MDQIVASTQIAVGIIFVASGASKLAKLRSFFRGLADYQLFPSAAIKPVGVLVVTAEIALGLAHLANQLSWEISALTITMLSTFLLVVMSAIVKHGQNELPCLCFGFAQSETVSTGSVIRIALLLGAELVLVAFSPKGEMLSATRADPFDVAVIACLVVLASYWISLVPALAKLARRTSG